MNKLEQFCGDIFSVRNYYLYTAICRWTQTAHGQMYKIKQVLGAVLVVATPPLLMQLIDEATHMGIDRLALNMVKTAIETIYRSLPPSADLLVETVKARRPDIYRTFERSDYVHDMPKLAYMQIFPSRNISAMTAADATERLAQLKTAPHAALVEVVDEWETGAPVMANLFRSMPVLGAQRNELLLLKSICDIRHQTGNMVFTANSVVLPMLTLGVDETQLPPAFEKLVMRNVLYKCTEAEGDYLLRYDYEMGVRFCKALMRIAKNFHLQQQAGEDPITDDALHALLTDTNIASQQKAVFRHIKAHPITIITGIAGSGKTEALNRAVNKLCDGHCIVATFIGYHANNLKKTRVGTGYTLHSTIAKEKRANAGLKRSYSEYSKKLATANAMVIDEICNVSMPTVVQALEAVLSKAAANEKGRVPITRLIVAGDPQQIVPIGIGQLGADMIKYLAGHVIAMTENMRVDRDSLQLVDIDKHLLHGGDMAEYLQRSAAQHSQTIRCVPVADLEREIAAFFRYNEARNAIFLSLEKVYVAELSNLIKRFTLDSGSSRQEAVELLRVHTAFMITDKLFDERKVISNLKSDEVRNGQQFIVRNMFRATRKYKTVRTHPIESIPRNVPDDNDNYMFVDCEDGTRICVHPRFVDPAYINPSGSATVNKLQGAQAPHVFCYIPHAVAVHRCWNRSHLHVIITRAQKTITFIADPDDIAMIAMRTEPDRITPMGTLLPQITTLLDQPQLASAKLRPLLDKLRL